jgi:vancomycin resistance protein VanJ
MPWTARRGALARLALVGAGLVWAARLGPSDRWLLTGLPSYVPPLGTLAAATLGAWLLRRAPGRGPWLLAAALVAGASTLAAAAGNARLFAPAAPTGGAGVRVLHWNVSRHARVGPRLRALEADVVALNEAEGLPRAVMGEGWHHWEAPTFVLASRHPLERRRVWDGRHARALHAVVRSDPPLSILLVDVAARVSNWRWRSLGALVAELPAFDPAPDLIVGDLNTPSHAASFGLLLDAGYAEVYRAHGAGPGYTWPSYLPLMRIDHVLVRAGVRVLAHESGFWWGSDHRWQRVTVTR